MKHLSIKDIARIAGVAPSTVSFVINGKYREMRISDQLVNHIKAVIKKNNYTPNKAAASLRTGKTHVIGLIVEDIANSFFASLAKSVENAAAKDGYRVVYGSTGNNDAKGNELIQLMAKQVDGFLIAPTKGMKQQVTALRESGKPVVLIDRYFPELDIPFAMVDNYAGVSEAAQYLIDNNKKQLAFVNVALDQVQMHERERAFTDTLRRNHLFKKELVLKLPYYQDKTSYEQKIRQFLQQHREIDAIIFATNYLGMYGIKALQELGIPVPRQIAILSFDDSDLFRFSTPSISVINQPVQKIANQAMQLLSAQLIRPDTSSHQGVLIKPELIIRNSI